MPRSTQQLAASDLTVGEHVTHREVTLDMAAFMQFSALTGDRHPIHYDAAYAARNGFRAPVAHGLLLLAISALGATDLSDRLHDSMVVMTGAHAKFLSPVISGDTVRLDYVVASVKPHAAGMSKVAFEVRVSDAHDSPQAGKRPKSVFLLEFLLKDQPSPSHESEH